MLLNPLLSVGRVCLQVKARVTKMLSKSQNPEYETYQKLINEALLVDLDFCQLDWFLLCLDTFRATHTQYLLEKFNPDAHQNSNRCSQNSSRLLIWSDKGWKLIFHLNFQTFSTKLHIDERRSLHLKTQKCEFRHFKFSINLWPNLT